MKPITFILCIVFSILSVQNVSGQADPNIAETSSNTFNIPLEKVQELRSIKPLLNGDYLDISIEYFELTVHRKSSDNNLSIWASKSDELSERMINGLEVLLPGDRIWIDELSFTRDGVKEVVELAFVISE